MDLEMEPRKDTAIMKSSEDGAVRCCPKKAKVDGGGRQAQRKPTIPALIHFSNN